MVAGGGVLSLLEVLPPDGLDGEGNKGRIYGLFGLVDHDGDGWDRPGGRPWLRGDIMQLQPEPNHVPPSHELLGQKLRLLRCLLLQECRQYLLLLMRQQKRSAEKR